MAKSSSSKDDSERNEISSSLVDSTAAGQTSALSGTLANGSKQDNHANRNAAETNEVFQQTSLPKTGSENKSDEKGSAGQKGGMADLASSQQNGQEEGELSERLPTDSAG